MAAEHGTAAFAANRGFRSRGPAHPPGSGGRRADRFSEDDLLLELLRRNPRAAAEALFDRYHGRVYGLAHSILRDESDAEEAVQDVFLTVIRKVHLFKGDAALYSWIYRICVNCCLIRLRRNRRFQTVPIEEFLPVFTGSGAHAFPVNDWSREVERQALDKELGRVILKSAASLPQKYRIVFLLCDVEGLSYEETAVTLGLGVPGVKSRLHRARLSMRERLSRYLRNGKVR